MDNNDFLVASVVVRKGLYHIYAYAVNQSPFPAEFEPIHSGSILQFYFKFQWRADSIELNYANVTFFAYASDTGKLNITWN